jgi:hypothetical protein
MIESEGDERKGESLVGQNDKQFLLLLGHRENQIKTD